jgi:hypothetical protein
VKYVLIVGALIILVPWRVIAFAVRFKRLPVELRDGQAALRSILIAIDQDGYR